MYNGVGLQTPRGSGTNGYIQKSMAFLKPKRTDAPTDEFSLKPIPTLKIKSADNSLLDHEKKRKIEVEVLKLKDSLYDQSVPEDKIEQRASELRKKLQQEGVDKLAEQAPLRKDRETSKMLNTHEIAALKEKEMELISKAFNISSKEYKVGSAFDFEAKRLEKIAISDERRKRELEKEKKLKKIEKLSRNSKKAIPQKSRKRKSSETSSSSSSSSDSSSSSSEDNSNSASNSARSYSSSSSESDKSSSSSATSNSSSSSKFASSDSDTIQHRVERLPKKRQRTHNDDLPQKLTTEEIQSSMDKNYPKPKTNLDKRGESLDTRKESYDNRDILIKNNYKLLYPEESTSQSPPRKKRHENKSEISKDAPQAPHVASNKKSIDRTSSSSVNAKESARYENQQNKPQKDYPLRYNRRRRSPSLRTKRRDVHGFKSESSRHKNILPLTEEDTKESLPESKSHRDITIYNSERIHKQDRKRQRSYSKDTMPRSPSVSRNRRRTHENRSTHDFSSTHNNTSSLKFSRGNSTSRSTSRSQRSSLSDKHRHR